MSTPTPVPPETPATSTGDRLLGRVVLLLGVVAILDLLGIAILAYAEKSVPDALVGTLGGAITGLAGLLAARRT